MSGPDVVAVQLAVARLPVATATRVGWYAQHHSGAVAAVFWTVAGQDAAAIARPVRMVGLGSIIDALVGRWDLALYGQHPTDGAPICVLVRLLDRSVGEQSVAASHASVGSFTR